MFERIQFEEGETLILTVRKHWFVLFGQCVGLVILLITPFILFAVIASNSEYINQFASKLGGIDLGNVLTFLSALWGLMIWIGLFMVWTNYYLDIWAVTTLRVIVVDQRGLFHRTVSSFRLERLQDIHVEVNGIIATMLDFGTIRAETAGHGEEAFVMHGAPMPQDIKSAILGHADALMPKENSTPSHDQTSTQ